MKLQTGGEVRGVICESCGHGDARVIEWEYTAYHALRLQCKGCGHIWWTELDGAAPSEFGIGEYPPNHDEWGFA